MSLKAQSAARGILQPNRHGRSPAQVGSRVLRLRLLFGACVLGGLVGSLSCSTTSDPGGPAGVAASGGSAGSAGGSAGSSTGGSSGSTGGGSTINIGGTGASPSNGDEQLPPSALPEGGEVLADGFDEGDKAKLDGTPVAASAPIVAYPLPHSLFPANLAPVEVHLTKANAAQTLARLSFHVEGFDLALYATCGAAELEPDGCVVSIPADVCKKLGDANYFGALTTTVRLSDADGGNLGEATLEDVSWTYSKITGGLYYWSTGTSTDTSTTAIKRYDFSKATDAPEVYWAQNPDSPAVEGAGEHACMGCHAISRDGTKMALSFGGSIPAAFELIDVATREPIAARLDTVDGFASMSTFSPDNARIINSYRGKLLLREANESLADVSELFTTDTTELTAHPFWSPTGDKVAFVSFNFTPTAGNTFATGDIVQDSQIWVAPSDGSQITGPASVLVPRAAGKSSYYPAISDDGKFIVFNQSSCDAPNTPDEWGASSCDGYNDLSARLLVVPAEGGAPVDLAKANGSDWFTNSWPRWSPDQGRFQQQPIYWVAFSSRRPYGLRLPGGPDSRIKPQLWFAAVRATPGQPLEIDPSFSPIWLPGQNDDMAKPTGNHIPQWVEKAVPVVVK